MQGEGSTPESLPSDALPPGPEPDAAPPAAELPRTGLVRLRMLTVDSEPASPDPDGGPEMGRIPHPHGRPVVVELPTEVSALSAQALQTLADIAESLSPDLPTPPTGQKKAGHDGPAKSNREVKKMSAKHHRLREPK